MEAVGNRLHAGYTWLSSFTPFDSLSIPFVDSSGIGAVAGDGTRQQSGERLVFVDQNGHQMSEAEMEGLDRAAFSESPWGFVASRYALTLGVMAVVVNRITHICRPQGRPRPLPGPRRLAIQLPTFFFLAWSGFLLLLVTMQSFSIGSASLRKASSLSWIPLDVHTLVHDQASEEDVHAANAALLWRLFLSVCFAVVSSTLLRTLEGHNSIVNPDDLGNFPTFNLVGFAVLLHLHASSYTFPPNKHVYLSILFQVGEVLGLQACTCWITPPVSRLTITSVFGLTSTLHYLLALQSGDRGYPFLQSFSRAPDVALIAVIVLTLFLHALTAIITSTPLSFSRLIDPRSLPLPTEDYNLALFKLGTACLTSTRLSGLDSDLIDISTSKEAWIEVDDGDVRVRASDGSLLKPGKDQKKGFGNEIRRIRSNRTQRGGGRTVFRSPAWKERWRFLTTLLRTLRGLVVWSGGKIAAILPFDVPAVHLPQWIVRLPRWIRLAWHGQNGEERRRVRLEEQRRQDERLRAAIARAEQDRLEGAGRAFGSSSAHQSAADTSGLRRRALSPDTANLSPNSWHRYFQQDFDDDDEDEEWREESAEMDAPVTRSRQTTPTPANWQPGDYWQGLGSGARLVDQDSDEDDEDEDDGWHDDVDPADMSAELLSLARHDFDEDEGGEQSTSRAAVPPDQYARILMAHMSTPDSRVLTRRGYRDLVGANGGASEDARLLADIIRQRRSAPPTSMSSERERMRLCVICYAEDRTIICWPCKCLALCDGCREAMAARPPPRSAGHRPPRGGGAGSTDGSSAATHTCPTCRTPVVGFSRIFLP